jgi:hypothetical protein
LKERLAGGVLIYVCWRRKEKEEEEKNMKCKQ